MFNDLTSQATTLASQATNLVRQGYIYQAIPSALFNMQSLCIFRSARWARKAGAISPAFGAADADRSICPARTPPSWLIRTGRTRTTKQKRKFYTGEKKNFFPWTLLPW